MDVAIVVGVVATAVALLGILGRTGDGRPWPSQVVVIALPLGIVAGGYAASVGVTLVWALVVVVSVFLAIVAGTLVGAPPALADDGRRPAAMGLSLAFSGLIALGLAVIVVTWAGHLIAAFGDLNDVVVKFALVAAASAYALGGRAIKGLSRVVLGIVAAGSVGMLALGIVVGDVAGLTSPEVPVPALSAPSAVAFAIGVVLIGAGFPLLRTAAHGNRSAGIWAAVIVSLVVLLYLVGMMALYGGAFQLPSLVINVFPVYTPPYVAAALAGLVTVVSTVVAGSCIHAAAGCAERVEPSWTAGGRRGPLRVLIAVMGVAVVAVALASPTPVAVVAVLAVLGAANLVAERTIVGGRSGAPEEVPEPAR